jgi:hypothetical protein
MIKQEQSNFRCCMITTILTSLTQNQNGTRPLKLNRDSFLSYLHPSSHSLPLLYSLRTITSFLPLAVKIMNVRIYPSDGTV